MKRPKMSIAVGLMAAATLAAQGPGPRGRGGPGPGGPGGFGGPFGIPGTHPGQVVTGEPYTGTFTDQSVQTLQDGNTITHTSSGKAERDAAGRTLETVTSTTGPMAGVTLTFITDPVANVSYTLNSKTLIAIKRTLPPPHTGTGTHTRPTNPNETVTDLGPSTVNGVAVTGKQITITIPAGTVGNANPIVSTSTIYTSTALGVVVQATRTDPRGGSSTYNLTVTVGAIPPETDFQVPSGYTIQDAKGWGGPRERGNHGPPPQ